MGGCERSFITPTKVWGVLLGWLFQTNASRDIHFGGVAYFGASWCLFSPFHVESSWRSILSALVHWRESVGEYFKFNKLLNTTRSVIGVHQWANEHSVFLKQVQTLIAPVGVAFLSLNTFLKASFIHRHSLCPSRKMLEMVEEGKSWLPISLVVGNLNWSLTLTTKR